MVNVGKLSVISLLKIMQENLHLSFAQQTLSIQLVGIVQT